MYRVVLLMLALVFAASAESYACFRHRMFRNRVECCPPVCEPAVNGEMPQANENPEPEPEPSTPLTAAEEKQLKDLLAAHKKAGSLDEKGLKEFAEWFRNSATPAQRADEKLPEPEAAPLSKEEEKQLKAILEHHKKNKTLDAKELTEYEKWYKESATPKDRKQDFDDLKKSGTQLNAPARILVRLPAEATLTFDGSPTTSTSKLRLFSTPAITASALNLYELQATIERNGMRTAVKHVIRVRPGQTTELSILIPMSLQIQTARR